VEPENSDLTPSPSPATAGVASACERPDLASRDRIEERAVDDAAVRRVFTALELDTPEKRARFLFDHLTWVSVMPEQPEEPTDLRVADSSEVRREA